MKQVVDKDRFEMAELFSGTGVEVGVAGGKYSAHIMRLGKVVRLYGVDPYAPHQGYRDFTRETTFSQMKADAHALLDRYPNYEFIEDYSVEAAKRFDDGSLDFVYIDGDHSYEGVTADIYAWLPKVKPGGILAGDDYIRSNRDKRFYDVIRAVDEFAESVESAESRDLYIYHKGRNPSNWLVYV